MLHQVRTHTSTGRLLYTNGDVVAAIELFLSLLRLTVKANLNTPTWRTADAVLTNGAADGEKASAPPEGKDKPFLDDFRTAYSVCIFSVGCQFAAYTMTALPFDPLLTG